MKTQMYLTPSQVEELRELGVEFESTKLIYIKDPSVHAKPHYDVVFRSVISEEFENEWVACPSLQEVLEKLPSFFHVWNEPFEYMQPFDLEIAVYHTEAKFRYGIGYNSHLFYDNNLLLAAFELLKWVAINHPDKIK